MNQGLFILLWTRIVKERRGSFMFGQLANWNLLLEGDFDWVRELYEVNLNGHWEDGNYVLLRRLSDKEILNKTKWSQSDFEENLNRVNDLLLTERSHRIRPGLDDKCLTSWNAMMLKGLCEAYTVFKEDSLFVFGVEKCKMVGEQPTS